MTAFGVEVIKRLAASDLPPHIQTLDVGTPACTLSCD